MNPFSYYFRTPFSRDLLSRRTIILTSTKASIEKPNMPQVELPLVLVAPDSGPLLSPVEIPCSRLLAPGLEGRELEPGGASS
ncbi:MAG: hypothetical protein O7D91_13860, partial [Planctomycetota bacterium]|nr:hypothetical protein [Planctomycetota bacterium]